MDLKIVARMIAVLALGAALTATIVALRNDGKSDALGSRIDRPGDNPAGAELARCRGLGLTAAEDAACKHAWAENRRRFFEQDEPVTPRMPEGEHFGGDSGNPDLQPGGDAPVPSERVSP